MNNVSPHYQIDKIFTYVKEKADVGGSISREYIWNLYVDRTPELNVNKTMYNEIIQKLAEDGYIRVKQQSASGSNEAIHVTFKGRLFNGYAAEAAELQKDREKVAFLEEQALIFHGNTISNSRKLNSLTIILAIGTSIAAIYYILEILDHILGIYPKS